MTTKVERRSLARAAEAEPTILGLPVHPDADLFPLMEGEAFEELKASIKKHGLKEPISVYGGQILDGRNRARALQALGPESLGYQNLDHLYEECCVELSERDLDGMTPAEFVAIENIHRRHMTAAQKKTLTGKLAIQIKREQAEKRKSEKVDALAKAAAVTGVSRSTAARAVAEQEGRKPTAADKIAARDRRIALEVRAMEAGLKVRKAGEHDWIIVGAPLGVYTSHSKTKRLAEAEMARILDEPEMVAKLDAAKAARMEEVRRTMAANGIVDDEGTPVDTEPGSRVPGILAGIDGLLARPDTKLDADQVAAALKPARNIVERLQDMSDLLKQAGSS